MENNDGGRRRHRVRRVLLIILLIFLLLTGGAFVYLMQYYHASGKAVGALSSDGKVKVSETVNGWRFDGPGRESAVIFYPGAKVDARAYAPLMHRLAENGRDAFLVKMPFRMAFFNMNAASDLIGKYNYQHWYLMGHSLGGVAASSYAADHQKNVDGLILLASYPTEKINCPLVSIRGSRDGVLKLDPYQKARSYWPRKSEEVIIAGGNHAQYGDYGVQKGDKTATVSRSSQQEQTAEVVLRASR